MVECLWFNNTIGLSYINLLQKMSQLEKHQQNNIFDITDKLYEHRSTRQHSIMTQFITKIFDTISPKMAKLFSFYFQRLNGPLTITNKQFSSQSFLVVGTYNDLDIENPQSNYKTHVLTKDKKVVIQENQSALLLDYTHYLNCQTLGQSSIEQQISFMHSSQFLCSIPKRRLFYILRKSSILKFSISQAIYQEGQQIEPGESGSGVYLVRKGDFGYFKYSNRQMKQIQTLGFSKGHLFGTLQINLKTETPKRQFTVKCKSHIGMVYRFSEQIYFNQIKPYCDNVITAKQSKLMKYIDIQLNKSQKARQTNAPLLSQTISRGFSLSNYSFGKTTQSNDFPLLTRTKLSVPQADQINLKPLLSQRIEQEGLKKTNFFSLTKQGPLKAYPMISQRSNFTESQFRQFTRLQRNKQMCEKVKQIKARGKCSTAKGQLLFSFFKQTWNFDKQKKVMLANRRYA